jgi:large subunit ribosomal protein L6e
LDEKFNDAYFAKPGSSGPRDNEAEFFEEGKPKPKEAYPEAKAGDQKTLDQTLLAEIKKTENLSKYLKASFGLSKGQVSFHYPRTLVEC